MERQGLFQHRIGMAAFLPLMALALSAQTQPGSVSEFKLPPGEAPQAPAAEGPVDPERPVPVQGLPAPSASPSPAPPPVAPTQPSSPPVSLPPGALPSSSGAVADSDSPARETRQRPVTEAAVPQAVSPAPPAQAPEPSSDAVPATRLREAPPVPVTGAIQAPPAIGPSPTRWPWIWWLLAALSLALLTMGLIWRLRRWKRPDEFEAVAESEQPPLPVEKAVPSSAKAAATPAPPSPGRIELIFEPESLTMALVNARLAYRLSLTNRGNSAIGPVAIACDIISAHASVGGRDQLLLGGEDIEPRHRLGPLMPGETVSLAGELHLPIAAILPVRSGGVSLFVPLARFRLTAQAEGRPPMVSTRIFVIGENPQQPGRRLKPIRIDGGPRTFSRIGQREIKDAA